MFLQFLQVLGPEGWRLCQAHLPAPALALKLAEHSAAQTGHTVHLLPSLGSPTKLATLPAGTLVAVTEVLAGGLAYRVYVPTLGLTGIVPKNSIVEMHGLQHVQGAEFKRDVPEDEHAESLDEVAKQNPELAFLAWNPKAPAEKVPQGPKVEAMSRQEIQETWESRWADQIQLASDPQNKLKPDQMYQIWLNYYIPQFNAAVEEMKRVEAKTRQQLGAGEYSYLEYEFEKLHKRDAFGPEYQAAADRLAALRFITRYSPEVRAWLETQDSLGKHVTLQETTAEAIAISKAHHNFDFYFAPIVYGVLALEPLTRGAQVVPEEAALKLDPIKTDPLSPPPIDEPLGPTSPQKGPEPEDAAPPSPEPRQLPARGETTRTDPSLDRTKEWYDPSVKDAENLGGMDHLSDEHAPWSKTAPNKSKFTQDAWNDLKSLIKETVKKGKSTPFKLMKGGPQSGSVYDYKFLNR
jgi:hypothetical protein